MYPIPDSFARHMVELAAEAGAAWVRELPAFLEDMAQRWSLTLLPPYDLSYNYVAPAVRADGSKAVLKVGMTNPELLSEIAALQLYDGQGMVRLLAAEPEKGVMLLERIEPGTPLVNLDDEQATSIAAQVMRQLWRPLPPDHPFGTVADWAAGLQRLRAEFGGGTGPFPRHLVEMAESLFAQLLASMAEPVLLHGDLHHWNILSAERQPWLALDPKGIVGEPAYEVGALLRNPDLMPRQVQKRRVDQLAAELGFDRERILGWGFAQAVLSAWWSYEDEGYGWESALACAEILASLLD
jgi:streptomycin 6-kinase